MESMTEETAAYFASEGVLDLYARATAAVGLWRSEEAVCERYFSREARILDLGCGTGRIALGLHELGYAHVIGVDLSRAMVKRARHLAMLLEYEVSFQVGDATALDFDDGIFDGVIFGFNGLMQIPSDAGRRAALREIRRVVRPGGHFVFTTHDRSHYRWREFWREEADRWARGEQDPRLSMFGDRLIESDEGTYFIHVPSQAEVETLLLETGWGSAETSMRDELANEPPEVRDFADDCRFWVLPRD